MPSPFTKPLKVTPLADGRTWILLEPFAYDIGNLGSGNTIQVSELFMTNFASVPRPLWSVFPTWGQYGNAAVIHDYGYKTQTRTRLETDRIFLEGMIVLGVKPRTRMLIYWGVRAFGWLAWKHNAKRNLRGVKFFAPALPAYSTTVPTKNGVLLDDNH